MRSTLDKIFAAIGILLAIALAIGAALLFWAGNFVGDQMKQNLTEQAITMPTDQTGLAQLPKEDQDALRPYAGTPLDNGDKAKAYADHFIAAHMKEASGGKTFSELGNERMQKCQGANAANAQSEECQKLQALGQTMFQGNTLRGLLTFGYAFGTMGKIANIAAWVASLGAVLFLILGLLGFNHAKKEQGHVAGHTDHGRVAPTGTTGHVAGTDGATRA